MKLHRNSQKRIYIKDAAYFVTAKTFNNELYFQESILADLFVKQLRGCKYLKAFELYGWFLGYDHFHLQFRPNDRWNISDVMHFLKRNYSRNANFVMGFNRFDSLTIDNPTYKPSTHSSQGLDIDRTSIVPSENRDYTQTSVIPTEGRDYNPGLHGVMDIRLFAKTRLTLKFRYKIKYLNRTPLMKFQWQEKFHDHYIRNGRDFRRHLEYIAYNPIKHKLPQNWPYVFTNPAFGDLIDPF
jgi:REP element-mobilizing transposase RayT